MKKMKLLLFSMFITLLTFTSCTNDDVVNTTNNVENSASVKTALAELETHFDENGRLDPLKNPIGNIFFDFCFDFVYPINLTYNTGVDVTVNSFDELVGVILSSTDTLFINGISFPFDVEIFEQGQIVVQTISNEQEFATLIETCGFEDEECICTTEYAPVCVEIGNPNDGGDFIIEFPNACHAECEGFTQNDFVDCEDNGNPISDDDCFEYVFPISVMDQNDVVEINSIEELELFIFVNGNANFIYPFEVIQEGDMVIIIENENDYITLLESCNTTTCEDECPQDGNPVCVSDNGLIIEFANECLAFCAGYTPNNFVDCNSSDCESNCPEITVYAPVCVNVGNEIIEFESECLALCAGYTPNDFVECNPTGNDCEDDCPQDGNPVCVSDNDQIIEFANECLAFCAGYTPNNFVDCNPIGNDCEDDCPQDGIAVCVLADNNEIVEFANECLAFCAGYTPNNFVDCNDNGNNDDCWSFVYPILINIGGEQLTINSDNDFDAQFDPNNSSLVYPFDVTINGETQTIVTPNNFFEIGEFANRCE